MENTLGLLNECVGSGGSLSTVSKEEINMVLLTSEVSSSTSYHDDAELELGLGLSLGGGGGGAKAKTASWGGGGGGGGCQYARILTAKDFPSVVSTKTSSSSSSSSSPGTKTKANPSCGTKRAADSVSPPRSGVSQVVGWPPVRTYRINNLINQAKTPITEEFTSTVEKGNTKNLATDKIVDSSGKNKSDNGNMGKGLAKTSLFVKVNMDGIPIGRKVDLNAHGSYEALSKTLDDMFCRPSTAMISRRLNVKEQALMEATRSLRLLDESSEFVLTYEDKDGDWMLVGDVPWEMFLSSAKRLRIMRTSEANGLAPRCQERSERLRTKAI